MQTPAPLQWSTVHGLPSDVHACPVPYFEVVHVPGELPLHVGEKLQFGSGFEQLAELQHTPSTQLPLAHSPAEHATPSGL
jgi:hypothetical protein